MNLQRINVKIFTDAPRELDLDPFLAIFARWREDGEDASEWVDLADYAHVDKGPGVMLVGRTGNVSLNLGDPGPGILYENKKGLDQSDEVRIEEAFRRCARLALALTSEPGYPDAFSPRSGFWELTFNDRLETPNDDRTDQRLGPAVRKVVDRVVGGSPYSLIRQPDPARRYGFTIHCETAGSLADIAGRL